MRLFATCLRFVSVVAVTAGLMSGCGNVQGAYKSYKDNEELAYINDAKQSCLRYGFKFETDAFSQCVNTNVNAAKDRDAIVKAAFYAEKK